MDFIFRKFWFLILIFLAACTAPGGGPLSGGSLTGALDAPMAPAMGTVVDGSEWEAAANTPDRPGSKIDLDPHDEFYPVYIPDVDNGIWYLYEECFPNHEPRTPACKYFTIPCAQLEEYTIEYHLENPNHCRVPYIINLWGDCSSLKYCSPLNKFPNPNPAIAPREVLPIQQVPAYSGKNSLGYEDRHLPLPFDADADADADADGEEEKDDTPWQDENLK